MEVTPVSVSYGIHFKTVLFPISFAELVSSLEKLGYELSSSIPSSLPLGRMIGTGDIARKGRATIQIDASAQWLRVADISTKSALNQFEEIENKLIEDHNIHFDDLERFYIFVAEYVVASDKPTYEYMGNKLRFPLYDDIEKIMGENIWSLGLRFAGANLVVNSDNWFDVRILPNFERDDSYRISVVFRNNDRSKTEKFLKSFEEKIIKIIELINR